MDDMMTAYVALQEAAAVNHAAAAAATAAAAAAGSPPGVTPAGGIRHTLDIGCGIGSVLLMVAWGLRRQHMEQQQQQGATQQQQLLGSYGIQAYGVEAQAVSFQLAQRSVRYNLGCSAQQQVQVRLADTNSWQVVCCRSFRQYFVSSKHHVSVLLRIA
jgi:hypothetical protein